MLIVDFSQLAISSYMAIATSSNFKVDDGIDTDLVRHVCLDGIRYVNSKFKRKYGSPVLAIDSPKGSWRKQVFPYYKASRSKIRKDSAINWVELLAQINTIKQEIVDVFPYKVIEVTHAEADDIIGVLVRNSITNNEETMIVSGDKDFIQLQIGTNLVQQWDKRLDRYLGSEDPKRYLFEHVLKGDSGDGIPNVLSPGDAFVSKIRQRPMTQKRMDEFWENPQQLKEFPRFIENLKIIDLKFTPPELQKNILDMFNQYQVNEKNKLHQYFISKRMRKLYESIGDF